MHDTLCTSVHRNGTQDYSHKQVSNKRNQIEGVKHDNSNMRGQTGVIRREVVNRSQTTQVKQEARGPEMPLQAVRRSKMHEKENLPLFMIARLEYLCSR